MAFGRQPEHMRALARLERSSIECTCTHRRVFAVRVGEVEVEGGEGWRRDEGKG